jgi:TolA-binding protein
MSDASTRKAKLSSAVEALIEASSSLETDTIKSSLTNALSKVAQQIQVSHDSLDSKINNLNEQISTIKSDIAALKEIMEDEHRQKILERALSLVDVGSFKYYENGNSSKNTSDLATAVIRAFILGHGKNLPAAPALTAGNMSDKEKAIHAKDFVDKFAKQIADLIKKEPRVEKEKSGPYKIFYE